MTDERQAELDRIADRIDAHEGEGAERVAGLGERLRAAGEAEPQEHESLRDRLLEEAIEFESDHPALAAVLERAAALLGGAGL